uniref:Uncharacterized protein n=1 Tax=Arundo donax TaxID=35708 RepID=A0A0A9ALC2_ARUDO
MAQGHHLVSRNDISICVVGLSMTNSRLGTLETMSKTT